MNVAPPSPHSWAGCPDWARQSLDRILTNRATTLDGLWAHPERLMTAIGMTPDPWQTDLLRSFSDRVLVLTARQCGKSQTIAAIALHTALLQPKSLILLLSPSERQSGELALKADQGSLRTNSIGGRAISNTISTTAT